MTSSRWVDVIVTLRGGPAAGDRERTEIDRDHPIGATRYSLTMYRRYNKGAGTRAVYNGLTRTSEDTAVIDFQRIEKH